MDYAKFYTDANKALVDSLVSTWVPVIRKSKTI